MSSLIQQAQKLLQQIRTEEAEILKRIVPSFLNHLVAITGRPVRLIWDRTNPTAATDCVAQIWMNPGFFLSDDERMQRTGWGTGYHECGHIRNSPYGTRLMAQAYADGGATRRHLMNIIVDRKDDALTSMQNPGFAPCLRDRMLYIGTMSLREQYRDLVCDLFETEEELAKFLRNWRPKTPFEDFFFAAKWGKRPRHKATHKAMKYVSMRKLLSARPDELLQICEKVHMILGEPERSEQDAHHEPERTTMLVLVAPGDGEEDESGEFVAAILFGDEDDDCDGDATEQERAFNALCRTAMRVELGVNSIESDHPLAGQIIGHILVLHVGTQRHKQMQKLEQMMQQAGIVFPGPLSVGKKSSVPVKVLKPSAANREKFLESRSYVQEHVDALLRKLQQLETPSMYTLWGQDEGDIDTSEAARIAVGLGGFRYQDVQERDLDLALHFALDCSGSMSGNKLIQAKRIATLFVSAVQAKRECIDGHLWGYSSRAIYDCGEATPESSFINLSGEDANSDTHMLAHVGAELAKSSRQRKVLIVLCDDGPDSIAEAREISEALIEKGIIVIHILIGVHGSPDIFPIEILFSTMDECIESFGDLIYTILSNLRTAE